MQFAGHKYGESCCGTGWVDWRQRRNLSERVATSVSYPGGKAEPYTLNFFRAASEIYVQHRMSLRYGRSGPDIAVFAVSACSFRPKLA